MATNLVGEHGNLWEAVAVVADDTSAVFDCTEHMHVSIFGTSDSSNTLKVEVSANKVDWYESGMEILANGDFYMSVSDFCPSYLRVKSGGGSTVTATCQAKQ